MPRWPVRDYSSLPMPSEVDRAWAAGFWDGEGSTSMKRPRSSAPAANMRMYVSQKDTGPELLSKFLRIVVVGEVKERGSRPGVWAWTVNDLAGCRRVLDVLWPYLGTPKQNQAKECGYVST